jgi:hypothetical protein
MPFKSEKQERYLWSEHPEIARKWANEQHLKQHNEKRKKRDRPKADSHGRY